MQQPRMASGRFNEGLIKGFVPVYADVQFLLFFLKSKDDFDEL